DEDPRPERLGQPLLGNCFWPDFEQQLEQAKCFRRDVDGRPRAKELASIAVEHALAEANPHASLEPGGTRPIPPGPELSTRGMKKKRIRRRSEGGSKGNRRGSPFPQKDPTTRRK